MNRHYSPALVLLIVGLLTLLWWAPVLSSRPLARPDEARYGEISREMAVSHDYVTPRLNGLKYFEKPPLHYWATAASFSILGVNEPAARLWPTLCGFLTLIFAGLIARSLQRPALPAMLITASAFYTALLCHLNTLDAGLTAFMTGALWAFLKAKHSGRSALWMTLSGVLTGLAILSKGPVALVLPGLAMLVYTLTERNFLAFRKTHLPIYLVSLFITAAPWFILCSIENPEFAHFFFIHEHFERYTSTIHQRVEPVWYFIPVLLLGLLPWTPLLFPAVTRAYRERLNRMGFRPFRFLALYALTILAFFSVSGSKLPTYILPAFPVFTTLIAATASGAVSLRLTLGCTGLFGALLIFAAALFQYPALPGALHLSLDMDSDMVTPYAQFATSLMVSGGLFFLAALVATKLREHAVALIALASLAAAGIGLQGASHLSPFNSVSPWIDTWKAEVAPDSRFFSIRTYEQSLPFYLGRTVTLVDFSDELGPGIAAEPERALPTVAAFKKTWGTQDHDLAILAPETLKVFEEEHIRYRIVAQDPRHVVVSAR
jgi:hypothetical protein